MTPQSATVRNPRELTLGELCRAYREASLTPGEVTEAYLAQLQPGSVYRVVTAQRARQQAEAATRHFEHGLDLGPLQGIPIALKDLIDTRGEVTAAGSRVLAESAPAAEDAPAAARLDAAGAVFLGKTTMTELAYSGLGLNPHFGTPGNALDPSRIPGGSSSGSAVAVASRLACAAVGSDTGGSVRIPASFNGIVGLKTTNGTLPLDGCTPLSPTLDTLGPLARNAEDAWLLYLALSARPYQPLEPLESPLTLLVPENVVLEGAEPEVEAAFEACCRKLEQDGHRLEHRAVPELEAILGLYGRHGTFASHESLALYEEMLETRGQEIDPRVARRILEYRGRPATDYLRLVYAQRRMVPAFWQDYRRYDALLAPTVAILPPPVAALQEDDAYVQTNALVLRNTMLFNFLSGPAASVPCGRTAEGLSVGLMIATAPHQEELALGIAALLERKAEAASSR